MSTSNTFTADGVAQSFTFTFDYLNASDVVVKDNGTVVSATITGSVADLGYVPASGHTITVERSTDVSSPRVVFDDPSALLAGDLNTVVQQSLYRLEELQTEIAAATTGSGGGNMPTPAATSRFLVSASNGSGGYAWYQKTVGEVNTILGTTVTVPTPTSGSKFLVTDSVNNVYELNTISEVKTLLGIGSNQLPTIDARANYTLTTNSGGTAYELSSASTMRTKMGLGSAATLNSGTAVGQLVTLVSGTSGAALPYVSGENLIGVNKTIDYAMYERKAQINLGHVSSNSNSYTNLSLGVSAAVPAATSGWCSAGPSGGVLLTPGTYHVKAESVFYGSRAQVMTRFFGWTAAGAAISGSGSLGSYAFGQLNESLPATIPQGSNVATDTPSASSEFVGATVTVTLEGLFRIAGGNAEIAVDGRRTKGDTGSGSNLSDTFCGNSIYPCARLHIWKLA